MSPVHLCFVAVFSFFTFTEQSNLELKELENILNNLSAQVAQKNEATNLQRNSGFEDNSKFNKLQSPKYFFFDDHRNQQQIEDDLQQAVRVKSDRICKITGRCGCSGGRDKCGRSNRMVDKTVNDMDQLLSVLNEGLNREQNKKSRSLKDRQQKYKDRRERQANGQKRQEYRDHWQQYDDRKQKNNDRRQDQKERRKVYNGYKRWEKDEVNPHYNDKQQRNNEKQLVYILQGYDDDRKEFDIKQEYIDRRKEYEEDQQYAENRKQRIDKLRLYGNKRQEYNDQRLQQNDRRQKQNDDTRQEYDEYKTREDDENQQYDEKLQKNNDNQLVYILQEYDDGRQENRDNKRQKQVDRQQEYNDRRQQRDDIRQSYEEDQQYAEKQQQPSDKHRIYGDKRSEFGDQRHNERYQKLDDRRQEYDAYSNEVHQNFKINANNDINSIFDIVILETQDSNEFQNSDENEKVIDINDLRIQNIFDRQTIYDIEEKKKPRPDSITLEEFVKYYGKVKKKITNGLLSYVKGLGGGLYLSQLLPYQKKQIDHLKDMQSKKPFTDVVLKENIIQLLFGMLGNIKLLPHSKDDQTIYIPKSVYDAISLYNRNDGVRSNKRLIPLTLQQKQKLQMKQPGLKFSKQNWRRNNQEIPNYGFPFDLQVQGLGQIN